MERKKFLRDGLVGLGAVVTGSALIASCSEDDPTTTGGNTGCQTSPSETAGPFPIKSPAELVRENIIGDRAGVPLIINITVQDTQNNCAPLSGVFVDIWQCDAKGNYSEYRGQLDGNFTNQSFLRGRQTTDANGNVSFVSIYPGWYPGRAPHIHVEVLNGSSSLLVTQIAFPEDTSKKVYTNAAYNGTFDTSNSQDGIFDDSLTDNLTDTMTGNNTDGYTLSKVIKVRNR